MELQHLSEIERATQHARSELLRFGVAIAFIIGVTLYAATRGTIGGDSGVIVVIGAMLAGYMALNIGANDVANNVGPAVGARALSLFGALAIAAVFEAAGALVAGGDVIDTIRSGIINPGQVADRQTFIWIMLSALLGGAMWLNFATAIGAPVSTTHSIVGAVIGAGVAAAGTDIVDWRTLGTILASWLISPVLGALIAAGFLYLIKRSITYHADMAGAARRVVPWLIAAMAWSSSTFLLLKGLNGILSVGFPVAFGLGLLAALVALLLTARSLRRRTGIVANTKDSVNRLFTLPLVCAAALLSFAHGSNDVANAVGPLAAIVEALSVTAAGAVQPATLPMWTLMVGALGISVGLALFGPRVIRTIGSEITELDQMRAFCIAMAATLTVIVASQLGLPVSSTHIVVGGVFGVGFLREYLKSNYERMLAEIKAHHPAGEQAEIDAFMARFNKASIDEKGALLKDLKARSKRREDPANFSKGERKGLRREYKRELVRRSQLIRIAAAWVITVPASALLAAALFYMVRGMTLD